MDPAKIALSGSEHAHQVALFCAISQPEIQAKYPELMLAFAIPNGGMRDKITAGRLKAEGVKSGVWDIFLPVPIRPFNGLWIEMKVRPNKLTSEQHEWYCKLAPYGYDWFVAYTWQEAFDKMIAYIGVR